MCVSGCSVEAVLESVVEQGGHLEEVSEGDGREFISMADLSFLEVEVRSDM